MSNEKPPPPGRLLGTGWEPHIDEIDGRLVYSIPVASGHMDYDFQFMIEPSDLAVLREQPYRRAVLFVLLHQLLQNSTLPSFPTVSQAEFRSLADAVLFEPNESVEHLIKATSAEHNVRLHSYIGDEVRRLTASAG
ncbi:hypothetical protein [Sphingomonas sp.]|uniref:hypothetical protein n=1 Tax=Sphingomonas sp. TaxID=28214 RepID=UPI00307E5908